MADPTIGGAITTAVSGFQDQLWIVAPIGLGIAMILWGLPKATSFLKRLGK